MNWWYGKIKLKTPTVVNNTYLVYYLHLYLHIFFLQRRENSYCYNCLFVSVRKCSGVAHGKQRDRVRMSCSGRQYSSALTCMFSEKKKFVLICFVFFLLTSRCTEGVFGFVYFLHTYTSWSHRVIRLCLWLVLGLRVRIRTRKKCLLSKLVS